MRFILPTVCFALALSAAALSLSAGARAAAASDALTLLRQSDVRGGLVIHVGSTDGTLETQLAQAKTYLVDGLALSAEAQDAAREAVAGENFSGLASVRHWRYRARLPYSSNLASAVIADLDSLAKAAPPGDELQRIVQPHGILIAKRDGAWTAWRKPRPAALDDWTHFDHGASGNPVSSDSQVKPIRQQQWITGVQPNPFEGNPAGYDPGAGLRISGRYAVLDVDNAYEATEPRDRNTWQLQGRDAFNGVPLWSLPRAAEVARRRWSLVAADGEVYAWLNRDAPLTALDISTGKSLRTYAETEHRDNKLSDETATLRVTKDALVVGLRERIVAFHRQTGEIRWTAKEPEKLLLGAVVDEAAGRVYCLVAKPGDRREFGGRWPTSAQAEAVIAISLADGSRLWRCEDVASRDFESVDGKGRVRSYRRAPGQLIPAGERLVVFGSCAISGGSSPYIAAVDAATGKLLHQTDEPFRPTYNVASYNALWRDDAVWFAGAFTNLWRFDPATGKVENVLTNSWNQRCTRFTATQDYFLFGQSGFFEKDLSGEQVCVARSGCAIGNVPANGMTYFTPNACGCITQMFGFQAMTGEAAPPPVADELRLVQGDRKSPSRPVSGETDAQKFQPPDGPVAADWLKQWRASSVQTEPVRSGDIELVAVVHQHRLDARRDNRVLWSYFASGRISAPPIVVDKVAVFGAHDGWVYAVDIASGALAWKYLLAPAERMMVVNGQMENTWPVYGVCRLPSGEIVASAGTHPELDGGVTVAAFDPPTGELRWRKHLQKHSSKVPPGGKEAKIIAHSFINSVPRLKEGQLVLGDGGRKGGEFAFAASDTEAALNDRLNTIAKKK